VRLAPYRDDGSCHRIASRSERIGRYGQPVEEPEFNDPRLVAVYDAEYRT
jgi:hypothetical protein